MNSKIWLAIAATSILSGCVTPTPVGETEALPPEVLALVAPGQDTSTVRLQDDGCYWYLHNNVVESVYIPLLTRDQRMICVVAQR
ncbi:hypothetical protein [Gymnodinialimonas ceratoperidinii]|uniref:Lipoprotein n=1 Tax=Gymnodinialimonas ceratoperidinii TaxID=2856823 RepID=A0A8F6YBD1_9RHOB|nr:hypothetical protein [Gymnodinialimonas ceratoperidinii]QXT38080.1 hypothetical protein KYE46_08895 [Gymnodinialimonas ceratoperidinii]